ncbi:MAG: uncharacterized protein KVP18_000592 [Porospora cf. gigantea A]|uniref:uncharacterized protein n=1 Tax=Porospora cf. gigantea A TaxID=2853593 RepID=UPI00355A7F3F|nr:MAG: hypothetical protein KVP18_000592 [Porospora cf. gigantea A]
MSFFHEEYDWSWSRFWFYGIAVCVTIVAFILICAAFASSSRRHPEPPKKKTVVVVMDQRDNKQGIPVPAPVPAPIPAPVPAPIPAPIPAPAPVVAPVPVVSDRVNQTLLNHLEDKTQHLEDSLGEQKLANKVLKDRVLWLEKSKEIEGSYRGTTEEVNDVV